MRGVGGRRANEDELGEVVGRKNKRKSEVKGKGEEISRRRK